jgi:hypothetical protein
MDTELYLAVREAARRNRLSLAEQVRTYLQWGLDAE